MRKYVTLIFVSFIIFTCSTKAQIPNNSFENWANGMPDGWFANNIAPLYVTVTQSTDAHTGSYAVKGEVINFNGVGMPPIVQSGVGGGGFALNQRPKSITGYYKFTSVNGDRFGVNVALFKTDQLVAQAASATVPAANSYSQFSVDFVYFNNEIPDNCIIQILIASPENGDNPSVGSSYFLDDFEFAGETPVSVEIENKSDIKFNLAQNYPNPFNPSTIISYSIPSESFVTLKLYDIMGKEIATLVNEEKPAGAFTVQFDANSIGDKMTSGTYFYQLVAGDFVSTKKLVLIK